MGGVLLDSGTADAGTADAGPPDAGTGYLGCPSGCQNAHGTAECNNGRCILSCAAGFADCDGAPANGCESDTRADPRHCGSCTQSCDERTQQCVSGACELSPCGTGRGECDGDPVAACETDLTSSTAHCGFCGNVCSATQAATSCTASTCGIASCNAGYDDCDGAYANGCETMLATSNAHCGGCGNTCPATGGGVPVCNAGVCETHCDLNGVFALRLSVPTTWPGTSVLAGGNGDFKVWAKLELTHSGTNLLVQTTACGQVVPDFESVPFINEKYGVMYPGSVFDRVPPLASVGGMGNLSSTKLGSSFNLTRSAWVVGVTLSDPVYGAWPATITSGMQVDADMDGKPGVTLPYKSGSGYSNPPANMLGSTRATSVYLAGRVAFSLSGSLTSCNAWSGSSTVQDIDSHSIGCRTTSNNDCQSGEYGYLDSNAPNYQPQSASFNMVRLASTAACTEIRAALP